MSTRATALGDVQIETPITFSAGANTVTLTRIRRNTREGWLLSINSDSSFHLRGDLLDLASRIQAVIA